MTSHRRRDQVRGPTVAVTGHRDPPSEDLPLLALAVDRTLGQIRATASEGIPTLVSGLAEGADRLVAERALALGWRLVGVLALPADEFAKDFASEASRSEFRRLLGRCAQVIEASPPGTPRPQCYANVAERIIAMSDWLVALWDGGPAAGSGGTADVVARFLAHSLHSDSPGRARVAHLYTRRSSADSPHLQAVPGQLWWHGQDPVNEVLRRPL